MIWYAHEVLLLRFSKTCEFWSAKANWRLRFLLPSIILTDLSGNKLNFNRFKRSWFLICDWRISIRFVCFCVSRFVTCDRNYDWWQPKTQLSTRLLNFGVRMFVKSAVTSLEIHSFTDSIARLLLTLSWTGFRQIIRRFILTDFYTM